MIEPDDGILPLDQEEIMLCCGKSIKTICKRIYLRKKLLKQL